MLTHKHRSTVFSGHFLNGEKLSRADLVGTCTYRSDYKVFLCQFLMHCELVFYTIPDSRRQDKLSGKM